VNSRYKGGTIDSKLRLAGTMIPNRGFAPAKGESPIPRLQLGAASGRWRYQQPNNESGFVNSQ